MSGGPGEPRGYLDAVRRMVTGFVTFCAAKPAQMIALRRDLQPGQGLTRGSAVEPNWAS